MHNWLRVAGILTENVIFNSQFSILNFQFSILNSQFSILNSQFSILNSQFSLCRYELVEEAHVVFAEKA